MRFCQVRKAHKHLSPNRLQSNPATNTHQFDRIYVNQIKEYCASIASWIAVCWSLITQIALMIKKREVFEISNLCFGCVFTNHGATSLTAQTQS